MRKAIFITLTVVGTAVGWAAALQDGWGVSLVLMAIGAVIGAAIGGAVSGVGGRGRGRGRRNLDADSEHVPETGMTPKDLMDNHWRDQGRAPLVSAFEPEHGRHQFDPDKL